MKRRTVTVGRCIRTSDGGWNRRRPSATPMVRLRGRWLERLGFAEGRKYSVEALHGSLTLTLAERPPRREYSPEEAQHLVANLARRLEEIRTLLVEIRDGLPRSPEEDRMLEGEIPSDLATELYGTIECVLEDDLQPAIEELLKASQLTAADLARVFEEVKAERGARRRLFDAIAPREVELLDGKPPTLRRWRRKPKIH